MTGKGLFTKDNSGVKKFIGDLTHCSNYQIIKNDQSPVGFICKILLCYGFDYNFHA